MHAVIDKKKNYDLHFGVLAKTLRLIEISHIDTVMDKLKGERKITLNFVEYHINLYKCLMVIKQSTMIFLFFLLTLLNYYFAMSL